MRRLKFGTVISLYACFFVISCFFYLRDHIYYHLSVFCVKQLRRPIEYGQQDLGYFRRSDSDANSFKGSRINLAIFYEKDGCDDPKDFEKIIFSESKWVSNRIGVTSINEGNLEKFDAIIFGGGSATRQISSLSPSGRRNIKNFIEKGGGFLGVCAGAFLSTERYLGLINAEVQSELVRIPGVGTRSLMPRGPAIVNIHLTSLGSQIFVGSPTHMKVDFAGGPVLYRGHETKLSACIPLAFYSSEVVNIEPQRGTMINTPSILAARYGKGRIIIFGVHPERLEGTQNLVIGAIKFVVN